MSGTDNYENNRDHGGRQTSGKSVRSMGTTLTGVFSVMAVVMSAFSLYQTVIKQANLHLFIPDTISYTRDADGSYEVLVVPVTIANSGARDGLVSSLTLKVRNKGTNRERTFHATYIADQGYFSTAPETDGNTVRARPRPKFAFAPLVVTGRSGYSGSLVFYPREYSKDRVVPKEGDYEFVLSAQMKVVEKFDIVDRTFRNFIEPVSFSASLPKVSRYFDGQMITGKFVRMFVKE